MNGASWRAVILVSVLLGLLAMAMWWPVGAQPLAPTYVLARGWLSQTDQERLECTAAIGRGSTAWVILGHPQSETCVRLGELAGQYVNLVVRVEVLDGR